MCAAGLSWNLRLGRPPLWYIVWLKPLLSAQRCWGGGTSYSFCQSYFCMTLVRQRDSRAGHSPVFSPPSLGSKCLCGFTLFSKSWLWKKREGAHISLLFLGIFPPLSLETVTILPWGEGEVFVTCLSFKEKRYCPFFILEGCAEQSWRKKKTCASHLPWFITKLDT